MNVYYQLKTSGEIVKRGTNHTIPEEFTVQEIGLLDGDVHMEGFEDSESNSKECYTILMHQDNDFERNLVKSELPINKALCKFFPTSPYVGEMILLKTTIPEDDEKDDYFLVQGNWSYKVMRKYEMTHRTHEGINGEVLTSHHINKKYRY